MGLEVVLLVAALVAGATGTWSPCGFSMIETIAGGRDWRRSAVSVEDGMGRGARATVGAACVAFAIGAPLGGVGTFAALALAGQAVHGAGGDVVYLAAAAIAALAALAEARGVRIVPQVRRQLPEGWRRAMPMPVAAFFYGILLGLGFTTFVLTFGVWALAAISFAVGDPLLGAAVGLAFGVGRAVPICMLAPLAGRSVGQRAIEAMACRPALYRAARAGDAAALALAAVVLAGGPSADAAKVVQSGAADPTAAGDSYAFQREPDRSAVIRRGGEGFELSGTDPALGGPWAAMIRGDDIVLSRRSDLAKGRRIETPNADAVAVSRSWLAWRARSGERDRLRARRISKTGRPAKVRQLAGSGKRGQIGRPTLHGSKLAYAKAGQRRNSIFLRRLGKGKTRRLLSSQVEGLSNPALGASRLLYVRTTRKGDRLKRRRIGSGGKGRTIHSKRGQRLWSTSFRGKRALVTVLKGNPPRPRILSVRR